MSAGLGNPVGYVPTSDGGNPRTISGRARENISGGALVFVSGAADVISSGLNSFDPTTDLLFAQAASGLTFTGVAQQSSASGTTVSVVTAGDVILLATGTVTAGRTVVTGGANGVLTGTTAGHVVGRALSSATSGNFALVRLA